MSEVRGRVSDKRINDLIQRFLRSGIDYEGKLVKPEMGTPQGGPLSPLLANLMLDNLDREPDSWVKRRLHVTSGNNGDAKVTGSSGNVESVEILLGILRNQPMVCGG
jgi:retron-type reverse transcriptase